MRKPHRILEYHEYDTENYDFNVMQRIYKFENNYGASVLKHLSKGYSSGLWELAVIRYYNNADKWRICYTTPIASGIIENLTEEDIEMLLDDIEKLPENSYIRERVRSAN